MKKKSILLTLLIPLVIISCSKKSTGSNSVSTNTSTSIISSEQESSSDSAKPSSSNVSSTSADTSKQSSISSSASLETSIAVTSVSLNESSLEISIDDSSVTLTATVLPENATNKNVTWSSSDTSIIAVVDGHIMPVGSGTAIITVETEDGKKTAQCTITVNEPITIPDYVMHGLFYGETKWTDKPMFINPASTTEYMIQGVSLHEDDEFKIHMYGDTWYGYSDIKNSVKSGLVTAASSDNNIKVRVTGVYDIYADYNESDGGHIYLSKVDGSSSTVSVSGISLSNTGKYLLTRNEFTITATVYPNNATNKDIRWTSSDESIATVSNSGHVTAKEKKGSTTITAKTVDGNFTATCIVYVSPSQYPDYCLTGTVGGRSYSSWNLKYAAIPLSTGKYLIPDVDLVKGDSITITNNSGGKLKNKTNQTYTKEVNNNLSVNVYLNVNDPNKDYLSFVTKTDNNR